MDETRFKGEEKSRKGKIVMDAKEKMEAVRMARKIYHHAEENSDQNILQVMETELPEVREMEFEIKEACAALNASERMLMGLWLSGISLNDIARNMGLSYSATCRRLKGAKNRIISILEKERNLK